MRLLFTNPHFWPHVRRGSERLIHDLGVVMTERGHEVVVVTGAAGGKPGMRLLDGLSVRYQGDPREVRRLLRLDPMEGFAITAGLTGLGHPADVHHAFYPTDAYGLAVAGRMRRRPLVFSWHGIPIRSWWEANQPRTHRWYLRMARRADRITVMTEASAKQLRDDYGYDPVVLTPGVFVEDFDVPRRAAEGRTIVCAAAVDDPRKRIDLLLEGFEILARDFDDVRLLLVGAGDPTSALAQAARMAPGVAARVEWKPEADLPEAYAGCSVGALTSLREAFGLVVIEYLAAGMPAVVSDDGGSAELITPETGVAFASGDANACANALRRALELAGDPATAGRCKQRAQDYDWSRRATAYEDLYLGLG